jgi:hypothetical protein
MNKWQDFGFFDAARRPYKVTMIQGRPWMCYWHPDHTWVTLREVTQGEIHSFGERMTAEELAIYDSYLTKDKL